MVSIPFEIVKLYYSDIYGYYTKPIIDDTVSEHCEWTEKYAIKFVDDLDYDNYFLLGGVDQSLVVTEV